MSNSTRNNKPLTTEEFIARAKAKHGDKYDYSKSVYTRQKNKLIITCKIHGDFEQQPNNHFSGSGCPRCSKNENLNIELFKDRSVLKHGNRYDYSKSIYNGSEREITIICRKHGEFNQIAKFHYNGGNCPKCRKHVEDNDSFIAKSISIHGDKYDYLDNSFVLGDKNVRIICKQHGVFEQKMDNHFRRDGCKKCKTQRKMISAAMACREDKTSYKRSGYIKICKNNNGMSNLYVIEMEKDGELFYKVGITKRSVNQRFYKNPYKVNGIRFITGDAGFVFDLEKSLHRILSKYQYTPSIKFNGSTLECFSEIPKSIIDFIDRIEKSKQLQLIA